MPTLKPYTVIWVERALQMWQYFNCMAEDSEHAQEQCENAYPQGEVIWVNSGHDNTSMEELEVPE